MKTNNPIFAYGLIFTSIAWSIAAVIIAFKHQQSSFLMISFLAVLSLLCAITGVIVLARLKKTENLPSAQTSENDKQIAGLLHLAGLCGYIIPFANILLVFWLWLKHRSKSKTIYLAGLEAVNFQLTCGVYFLSAFMLCALFIGFIILPIIMLYHLMFIFIALIRLSNVRIFHYPGNLNFVINHFDEKIT